jgi:hypothetical protein
MDPSSSGEEAAELVEAAGELVPFAVFALGPIKSYVHMIIVVQAADEKLFSSTVVPPKLATQFMADE